MNELVQKITHFLSKGSDFVVSVTQGDNRLSKNTLPKYAFSLQDIEQIYGNVADFIKSLPEKGFGDGTQIALRRAYPKNGEITYHIQEKITLNFQKANTSDASNEASVSEPVSSFVVPMAPAMPQTAFTPNALASPYGMGYVPISHSELIDNKVIAQRYEDTKKQNLFLEDQLKDAKSEIRTLKEENYSLRLKIDTLEEKHNISLEREKLNHKGFWESQAGIGLMGVFEKVAEKSAPLLLENMMSPQGATALAAPELSSIKQAMVNIITSEQVSDEQVEQWYNLILSQNQ